MPHLLETCNIGHQADLVPHPAPGQVLRQQAEHLHRAGRLVELLKDFSQLLLHLSQPFPNLRPPRPRKNIFCARVAGNGKSKPGNTVLVLHPLSQPSLSAGVVVLIYGPHSHRNGLPAASDDVHLEAIHPLVIDVILGLVHHGPHAGDAVLNGRNIGAVRLPQRCQAHAQRLLLGLVGILGIISRQHLHHAVLHCRAQSLKGCWHMCVHGLLQGGLKLLKPSVVIHGTGVQLAEQGAQHVHELGQALVQKALHALSYGGRKAGPVPRREWNLVQLVAPCRVKDVPEERELLDRQEAAGIDLARVLKLEAFDKGEPVVHGSTPPFVQHNFEGR
mmetsp:Transcript_25500/g.71317  ORF Transcript_25500/g.71317 Transcript_25500/m.71317 type:complete len:332 (+) Transcript_25500:1691-2686(+)